MDQGGEKRHSNLKKKLLRRQWRCWWAKNKENYYENDNGPAKWVQFGISSSVDARQWWKVSVVPLSSCSSSVIYILYGNSYWKICPLKRKACWNYFSIWVLKLLIKCVAVMFLVLVGKLQANVWFTSAVPRLLHPGYFFQVSICFEGANCFLWGYMNISSNLATS